MDSGTWWEPIEPLSKHMRNGLEYLALRNLIAYSADGKLVRFVEGS